MKMKTVLILAAAIAVVIAGCSPAPEPEPAPAPGTNDNAGAGAMLPSGAAMVSAKEVEVGCAHCTYDISGVQECKVAVKVDGKSYLATNTGVDAHDAGLCAATKKATVTGKVDGNTFAATSFKLKAE